LHSGYLGLYIWIVINNQKTKAMKIFFVYHRAGYDLLYALRNGQITKSYNEALKELTNDYKSSNPSAKFMPDTEIFIYKIEVAGNNIAVNNGDYELDNEERWALKDIK